MTYEINEVNCSKINLNGTSSTNSSYMFYENFNETEQNLLAARNALMQFNMSKLPDARRTNKSFNKTTFNSNRGCIRSSAKKLVSMKNKKTMGFGDNDFQDIPTPEQTPKKTSDKITATPSNKPSVTSDVRVINRKLKNVVNSLMCPTIFMINNDNGLGI